MKKVMFGILISLLLIGVVSATLTKTRIYGETKPNAIVKLTLSYKANGLPIDSQFIRIDSDTSGDWEYKIGSDEGTIELEVTILDDTKTFEVPVGPDFEVSMSDEDTGETTADEETNETTEEAEGITETEETTGESTETEETETTNTADEESVEADVEVSDAEGKDAETSSISGKSIFGDKLNVEGGSIFLIILILFVTIVIANIFSEILIGRFKRGMQRKAERPVRIIKLSEKLEKARQKLEQAKKTEMSIQEQLKKESQFRGKFGDNP